MNGRTIPIDVRGLTAWLHHATSDAEHRHLTHGAFNLMVRPLVPAYPPSPIEGVTALALNGVLSSPSDTWPEQWPEPGPTGRIGRSGPRRLPGTDIPAWDMCILRFELVPAGKDQRGREYTRLEITDAATLPCAMEYIERLEREILAQWPELAEQREGDGTTEERTGESSDHTATGKRWPLELDDKLCKLAAKGLLSEDLHEQHLMDQFMVGRDGLRSKLRKWKLTMKDAKRRLMEFV